MLRSDEVSSGNEEVCLPKMFVYTISQNSKSLADDTHMSRDTVYGGQTQTSTGENTPFTRTLADMIDAAYWLCMPMMPSIVITRFPVIAEHAMFMDQHFVVTPI